MVSFTRPKSEFCQHFYETVRFYSREESDGMSAPISRVKDRKNGLCS